MRYRHMLWFTLRSSFKALIYFDFISFRIRIYVFFLLRCLYLLSNLMCRAAEYCTRTPRRLRPLSDEKKRSVTVCRIYKYTIHVACTSIQHFFSLLTVIYVFIYIRVRMAYKCLYKSLSYMFRNYRNPEQSRNPWELSKFFFATDLQWEPKIPNNLFNSKMFEFFSLRFLSKCFSEYNEITTIVAYYWSMWRCVKIPL